jgi:hypothetical protein
MKSSDFHVGDRFRILDRAHGPMDEIYTVRKVAKSYIVSEGDDRWVGTDCITTDTAFQTLEIQMISQLIKGKRKRRRERHG